MPAKNPRVFLTLLLAALALPVAGLAEEPMAISGRVVDAAGRPIAGAEIWELPNPPDSVSDAYQPPVPPPALSLAVSGADGRFVTRGVDPDSTVEVCRDGFLVEHLQRPLGVGPAEVVLHPVSRISGRVLAPDGSPVPGAAVSARDPRWVAGDLVFDDLPAPRPCPRSEPSPETATDAQGRFTLVPLRPGRYDVSATAPGYRQSNSGRHLDLGTGEELTDVEVRLVPGAVVRGRVATPAGAPIAGVRVSSPDDRASARTDAEGAYRLTGVSPGQRGIGAEVHEDGILSRSTWESIEVTPGENRLDFTLPPQGREVRGRVLAPDDTPVAGALLHPGSACPERFAPRPRTAADGSFVIHLPAGTHSLVATLAGYSPGAIDLPGEEPVVGAVIRLAADHGLSGRLLGAPAGTRYQGMIALERVEESQQPCRFDLPIEPDGRFRFGGLWPGEWQVTVMADRPVLQSQVKLQREMEAFLYLDLRPKLEVRGRVIDGEGDPVAGAQVRFEPTSRPAPEQPEHAGTTAADGTFSIPVESGTWTVVAERAGFASTAGEPVEVTGPEPRAIELVLRRGTLLRARVRGLEPGQNMQSLLAMGRSRPFHLQGEADADGGFHVSDLPPGDWWVMAELGAGWPDRTEVSKQVTVGPETREQTVDFAVPRGGLTLSAHVVDPGKAVVTVTLKDWNDQQTRFFASPAPNEPFRFTGLPPGSYLLEVDEMGFIVLQQEVELNGDREIILQLPHP